MITSSLPVSTWQNSQSSRDIIVSDVKTLQDLCVFSASFQSLIICFQFSIIVTYS